VTLLFFEIEDYPQCPAKVNGKKEGYSPDILTKCLGYR
jgi:hypothetical protein